jgi:hypothetical protein
VEGAAILTAVLAVAFVTATNDYSKEQQFRALNAVKEDIAVKVKSLLLSLAFVLRRLFSSGVVHLPSLPCFLGYLYSR